MTLPSPATCAISALVVMLAAGIVTVASGAVAAVEWWRGR